MNTEKGALFFADPKTQKEEKNKEGILSSISLLHMEFGDSERSSHGGGEDAIKDEKRSESSIGGGDDEDAPKQDTAIEEPTMTNTKKSKPEPVPISASSNKKEEEVDELENAKAEMGEVIKENQRLKMSLNRILNDYRTLQMQFHNIVQQETKDPPSSDKVNDIGNNEETIEESELVSLSLGRLPSNPRSDIEKAKASKPLLKEGEEYKEGLALGLDCKFETSLSKSESTTEHVANIRSSPTNSSEAPKEEEAGVTWPPSKVLKTTRDAGGEDGVSQHNPAKKARVCVRARCDTPTMNDGCQWRKYGQKISKGNPCPRAYYRCTVAPSCPVRKQVQRCAQDMSILITTYEGNHNHPLPLSATAMASTTSAAASMLLSGSSTSHSTSIPSSATATASSNNLHGMNFFLSDGSSNNKPKQFFHLSHPSLSSSPSQPTITLDLTSNPLSSSSLHPFGRFDSNFNNPSRYNPSSSTSLNFSSSADSISNAISWGNNNGFLSYNNNPSQPFNNRNILSTINLGRSSQPMENIYNSFMQRNNNNNNNNVSIPSHQGAQHSLPDTIAAATKVITADPNFQSALAAALTSIISTGSSSSGGNLSTSQGNQQGSVGENLGQKMKWGELFQASNNNSSTLASTSKANNNIGCASSFLKNKAAPANMQTGSLVFQPQPSLPFSSTKSASGSPGDNRDNAN